MALLPVFEDHVGEIHFPGFPNQVGRGRPAAAIHPHVERLVAPKAEAAALGVELQRRHAKVGERAVDRLDPARGEHVGDRAVVGVHELDAIAERRQAAGRERERIGVTVEADDPRRARFEQCAGVTSETDGTIHEQAAAISREVPQDLGGEDRLVDGHATALRDRDRQIPNSDSAFASSSVNGSRCSLETNRS